MGGSQKSQPDFYLTLPYHPVIRVFLLFVRSLIINNLQCFQCGKRFDPDPPPLAMVRFFEAFDAARILNGGGHGYRLQTPSLFQLVIDPWCIPGESSVCGSGRCLHRPAQRFPDDDYYLAPILWHIATLDETTLSALDGLFDEDGDAGATLATEILRKGPRGFALSHFALTMHLLEICSEK